MLWTLKPFSRNGYRVGLACKLWRDDQAGALHLGNSMYTPALRIELFRQMLSEFIAPTERA